MWESDTFLDDVRLDEDKAEAAALFFAEETCSSVFVGAELLLFFVDDNEDEDAPHPVMDTVIATESSKVIRILRMFR